MMRCGYLTFHAAGNDENTWSGLNFNIRQTVAKAGFQVEHLGGLAGKAPLSTRMRGWYYRYVARQGFDPNRDRAYLAQTAQTTTQLLREREAFDFLLAPSSFPLTGLGPEVPKFVWLDAIFAEMIDYYPDFQGISRETLREGVAIETETLRQCTGVLFSSGWAAESALRHYRLEESRVHVVPFGANMASPFVDANEATQAIQQRGTSPHEFLFLGIDWPRKGGPFALEVVRRLNELGLPSRLTIVGCQPPLSDADASFTRVIGFLDKTKPPELVQLRDLLSKAHFLILPTRAEAYGLVFAEAASFAVPSLAFQTGGVPTLVQSGQTGLLFPPNATPGEWAEKTIGLLREPDHYADMAGSAYGRYQQLLNWDVAAKRLREIILKSVPAGV